MGYYPTDKYRIKIIPSEDYSKEPPFEEREVVGKKRFRGLALKLMGERYQIKATNVVFCSVTKSIDEKIIPLELIQRGHF
jgi:hypothetical protein